VTVFTALEEQLGLKLESDRMPIQHVVIDHSSGLLRTEPGPIRT
jgi:uncharacterized protein (TIGR03435 family)